MAQAYLGQSKASQINGSPSKAWESEEKNMIDLFYLVPKFYLTRIIREGDEETSSRAFFEERQGKEEAEKGREESPGSIFR
jgi:hypothetical protein